MQPLLSGDGWETKGRDGQTDTFAQLAPMASKQARASSSFPFFQQLGSREHAG